ncbi:helix-turn-helix domain-containing protein [Paenibacillus doosanensis]|uniref:helix-turn-helix domain-containing protein n=1 Tax=Paenibacillus doosanensis TaxID=1229154 RepID=UPI0021801670|nr:helix-turn-helix domain-containing protein [Paenibacillus doosanensis]MCS7461431.1 helix-turn-helix domain-containing protein [Paenibacillus doosanensis]
MRGKSSNNNVFKRFMISFLSMLIIPIVLSSFTYYEAVQIVETQSREAKLYILEQARDMLDKQWTDMDEAAIKLSYDSRLMGLYHLRKPLGNSPELFDIWNYYKDFHSSALTGSAFTNTFFVVLKNSDLVFSKVQMTDSSSTFYQDEFQYEGMPYEEWHAFLFDKPHLRDMLPSRNVRVEGKETSGITYMTSLPLGMNQEIQAVVVFAMEDKDIMKLVGIDGTEETDGQTFTILNDKGEVVTASADVPIPAKIRSATEQHGYMHAEIGGEDHLFVYTRSAYNNLTYVVSLPIEQVMGKVNYIRTIALSVAAGTLVVGTIISLWMSYRHSKPWKDIVTVLKAFWGNDPLGSKPEQSERPNEVDYLQTSIARLIDNNQSLQQMLQRQADTLKNVFIERLFKGEFEDRAQMHAMLVHAGLEMHGNGFAIAVLRIYKHNEVLNAESLEELNILRALIEGIIRDHLQERGYVHTMHENELAILIRSDVMEKRTFAGDLDDLFLRINRDIKERYVIVPMIGIGSIYEDLLDVHYSYQEAKLAVTDSHVADSDKSAIVWYARMAKEQTGYYYPTEVEIRLMNVIKAGNSTELAHILQHLHNENFLTRTLSAGMKQHLFSELQATELKLKDELGHHFIAEENDPGFVPDFSGTEPILREIFLQFHHLCRSNERNKKSRNTHLLDKIVAYINDHFQDPNISLYAIASHFNLSESYLSQFFKEQSGETFSSYLEKLRISLACRLIMQGSASIDSIAVQAGYNSTHSFRRAFKRTMGVSPSSYKGIQG